MGVPPSSRRMVVITGGSDGIGAAAARFLARRGDHIILIGRSPAKTRSVAVETGAHSYYAADFADLSQVREVAAEVSGTCPRVDVLVNNAGLIAGARRTLTADGHELTFQVNHLAPFLLTMLLRDRLAAAGASVITTSSQAGASRGAAVDTGDLDMASGYGGVRAYRSSKLANVLFTRELARRWAPLGISAAAVHPGGVRTQWGKSGPLLVRAAVGGPFRVFLRSPEHGADTIVWLATTTPGTDWTTGGYYANRHPATPSRLADDDALAGRLWEQSAAMCGLSG